MGLWLVILVPFGIYYTIRWMTRFGATVRVRFEDGSDWTSSQGFAGVPRARSFRQRLLEAVDVARAEDGDA